MPAGRRVAFVQVASLTRPSRMAVPGVPYRRVAAGRCCETRREACAKPRGARRRIRPVAKWRSIQAVYGKPTCLDLRLHGVWAFLCLIRARCRAEGEDVKERILIVGNDPALLKTRRCLLADWQTTSGNTRDAEKEIRARAYDLLIFGQTVSNETARSLIALASELHPLSSSLVICSLSEKDRNFGSATYRVDLRNPGGLRAAVAKLLDSRP
jgi:hypothetical protein